MRDIKNYTIGFLSAVCLFLFYGYSDNKEAEFDKIRVKDLVVEDSIMSYGVNFLRTVDINGSITVHNGIDSDNKRKHSHLMEITSDGLIISRIPNDSEAWFNQDDEDFVDKIKIGITEDQDGMINLYDRYGDPGHQRLGTGKYWNVLNKND
ncbi:MAG: hypothetical protein CMG01_06885 [Candidatus Marinimicrobia bacterium]|nr:hypothetical protein [Candidatus Neomarinimicrobiota bacterium]